eukprot:TRINITY_DN9352_c0_g1_i2.p1 TRINITY_DN9352_c0_g1~~TRINITY_DN9352_c0_g1_i2.p1  ORF type:complete len:1001 (+),score=262.66 TRINITY_DN9352_c0_g1_i2:72-3005(+)
MAEEFLPNRYRQRAQSSLVPAGSPLSPACNASTLVTRRSTFSASDNTTSSRQHRLIRISYAYIHSDEILLIAIHEARLKASVSWDNRPRLAPVRPFVNVYIDPSPDEGNSSYQAQTRVVDTSARPSWEESFAFNLNEDVAQETRVHLGVWNQGSKHQHFLGGLSIPLHATMQAGQRFEGWYLLLNQEDARLKHVEVRLSSQSSGVASPLRPGSSGSIGSPVPGADPIIRKGQRCLALYADDGNFYPARVEDVSKDGSVVFVVYQGYEDEGAQAVSVSNVKMDAMDYLTADSPPRNDVFDQPSSGTDGEVMVLEGSADLVNSVTQTREAAVQALLTLLAEQQARLQHVMSVFHEPLMLDLTSEQHSAVFGNFDPIYNALCKLASELQTNPDTLGAALCAHAKGCRSLYVPYAVNWPRAHATYDEMITAGSDFTAFVVARSKTHPKVQLKETLREVLGHVASLLKHAKALFKETPESHSDYFDLEQAVSLLKPLNSELRKAHAQADGLMKMNYYDQQLRLPEGTLIQPGRTFLLELDVELSFARRTFLRKQKIKFNPVTVLVFSDMLILTKCTKKDKGNSKKYVLLEDSKPMERKLVRLDYDDDIPHVYLTYKQQSYLIKAETNLSKQAVHQGLTQAPQQADDKFRTSALEPVEPQHRQVLVDGSEGDVGFSLRADYPGHVGMVQEGGPAARAGLTDADKLLRVNTMAVDALSHEGLMELIGLSASQMLNLLVVKTLHKITLLKGSHRDYGLTLKGCNPVFVAGVHPDGPADKSGLRLGDRLWKIGPQYVRSWSSDKVTRALAETDKSVQLQVEPTLRRLRLPKSSQGYGFTLCQPQPRAPVTVQEIHKEGSAKHVGLRQGDQFWSINNHNVRGLSLAKLQALVQSLGGVDLHVVVISTLRVVELRVPVAGTSYGFELAGEKPVRLAVVNSGSPAARVGLRKGMPIWSVNGVSALDLPHSSVIGLMKQKSEYMRLVVPL